MALPDVAGDEINRRGLREQVHDAVLRMLLEGRIGSGERLSIEDVARQLDVSPTPVREAFVMLERTGLVSRVALRGYRVAPPLSALQLGELFDARRLLEVDAARRAFEKRDILLDSLRQISAEHDAHVNRILEFHDGDAVPLEATQAYFGSDAKFHHAIFQSAGNRYLSEMYESLGALTHRMRQMATRGPADAREASIEHHAIVTAFESGDADAVAIAMQQHIDNVRTRSLSRD